MDSISLENFRCFRDEQKVRLAPLTLLVGDNSTGKTSFLAMIRALWVVAIENRIPDFKEDPYDLGSFDDIAHHRGRRGGRADAFEAEFEARPGSTPAGPFRFSVVFKRNGSEPIPVRRCLAHGDFRIEESWEKSEHRELRIDTSKGSWMFAGKRRPVLDSIRFTLQPLDFALMDLLSESRGDKRARLTPTPLNGSPEFTHRDENEIFGFLHETLIGEYFSHPRRPPYASAPVRSRPRRTYDPARAGSDPMGDYIPMYLANMYFQDNRRWLSLKKALEDFGRASGLFDEIDIKQLGRRESEPFQLQIRKFGERLKGPPRNMIDVGYGVSQVLPVITELLRSDASSMFLLQQPEVHLHPSAQAALGSFFCEIAGSRQLIVETHSDHLLDRVRMDVRDGRGRLKPDDVSILYFERNDPDVRIHSLRLDEEGNVLGAPEGYRRFFMEETRRSLGF